MTETAEERSSTIAHSGPERWLAFEEAARQLSTPNGTVEVQGSVIHRDRLLSLSTATTLGCAATVLGVFFPKAGLVILVGILLGTWLDERGGRSWVRELTPKSIGRNVLLWPFGGAHPSDDRPIILICLESGRPDGRGAHILLFYCILGLVVAATGTAIHASNPDLPLPTQRWGAILLAMGPILALVLSPMERINCWLKSSIRVAEHLCGNLTASEAESHRIVIALVDQNPRIGDGLDALLETQHSRINPQNTYVVRWARGPDQFCRIRRRRRFGRSRSNSRLEAAILDLELTTVSDFASGAPAGRRGFPAISLRGGHNPQEVGRRLETLVRSLRDPGTNS